jgi:ADP-ribose pyrophosphatase
VCDAVWLMPDQEIYAGKVVTLRLKRLPQADGTTHLREIVEHAPGAAVVAVDGAGQVLLVRQLRPAVGRRLLELPAGLVDPGEAPIDAARRELEEETGFTAELLEPLVSFYTSPGFTTELIHVFVASGLRELSAHQDAEEDIEVVRLPLEHAIRLVLDAELSDAKTVSGLLAYRGQGPGGRGQGPVGKGTTTWQLTDP